MHAPALSARPLPALDESRLEIRGPWLDLALLGMERFSSGEALVFGSARADRFAHLGAGAPGASGMGSASIALQAPSPSGPPIGAVQDLSERRPTLAFLLDFVDGSSGELESHWIMGGRCQARFETAPPAWSELMEPLWSQWAASDEAAKTWLDGGPPAMGWEPPLPADPRREARSRQIARWLAGMGSDAGGSIGPWPADMPDPWLATASPWTPAPPWDPARIDRSPHALLRMSVDDGLDDYARLGAAKRLARLALVEGSKRADSPSDGAYAAAALGGGRDFRELSRERLLPMRRALSQASPEEAAVFGKAFERMGVAVSEVWEAAELAEAATANPRGLRALTLPGTWSFSESDLELIALKSPPELASLAEQELLRRTGEGAAAAEGSGRRRI